MKDYTVTLGVAPEANYVFSLDPPANITARVIARGSVVTDDEDEGNAHYTIAASNAKIRYAEVEQFVGLDSNITKARLIDRAMAEGFKLTAGIEDVAVDVSANGILAGAQPGDVFDVTFVVRDMPTVATTVKFQVIRGDGPVISVKGPLLIPISPSSYILQDGDLRVDVSAFDTEDGSLTSSIVVSGLEGSRLPTIDTARPGLYAVEYKVTDSDGNMALARRTVVVDDGRYELIDEGEDGSIDYIVGARNFVVNRGHVAETAEGALAQVKALSGMEAYDAGGVDYSTQVRLLDVEVDDDGNETPVYDRVPQGYLDKEVTVHSFVWTILGHPAAQKGFVGEIVTDDYVIIDVNETSAYTIIAKGFTVKTEVARNIRSDQHFISRTGARVVKLIDKAADKAAFLISSGGFSEEQGVYALTFGDHPKNPGLLITVDAVVSDGAVPLLSSTTPIVVPIEAVAGAGSAGSGGSGGGSAGSGGGSGSGRVEQSEIIEWGKVVATDEEARSSDNVNGDITEFVQVLDVNGQPASFAVSPAVHPVTLRVQDADGNVAEKKVAVVIADEHFVFGSGFILRAHDFDIDLRRVEANRPVEQISQEAEIQAWRNDGTPVVATVLDTDNYHGEEGTYRPVVGIYNPLSPAVPLVIFDNAILAKSITARVSDTYLRIAVTFDANGGVLTGPRVITLVEPQTTLPYLPASPVRDGYTFKYWSTDSEGGTQFAPGTSLTEDVTLYAIWQAIPVVPTPPAPTPPPSIIINNPPTVINEGPTYVTVETGPETEGKTLPEPEVPQNSARVGTGVVPESPASSPHSGWSLFNLIATLVAALLFVVFTIKFFFDRSRNRELEEFATYEALGGRKAYAAYEAHEAQAGRNRYGRKPLDAARIAAMTPEQQARYQARREAEYRAWLAERQSVANRRRALVINAPVLLIVIVALAEALIVLYKTQVFSLDMVFLDDYSVVFALVLFVQMLAPMVAAVLSNNKRERQRLLLATAEAAEGAY
jgi:uncharacterized repeat protein (TIGR02543 family)